MKVKLLCDKEKLEEYKKKLENGITISQDDFELIVIDPEYHKTEIIGKTEKDEYEILKYSDIIYVESYGHEIIANTVRGTRTIKEKLYEIEGIFENKGFLRVNKSYVINKSYIKTIKPTFNTKFILTMKNDSIIEVTRNYYYSFKSSIGL
ncbi:MAG: LytTR family DNA-binding domain-containing protein [Bacillota bacterium]